LAVKFHEYLLRFWQGQNNKRYHIWLSLGMKTFLLLSAMLLSSIAFTQDNWKISHNDKIKLQASAENTEKNVAQIKNADLAKKNLLQIVYKEITPQEDWKREIIIFDPADNELLRQKGSLLKVQNTSLKNLFKKSKTLVVYTMALPSDPAQAALVRVRRVHLCTLVLK